MLPITIVMTTYFTDQKREDIAQITLSSWSRLLKYDGEIRIHVADDGSAVDINRLLSVIESVHEFPYTFSKQTRQGVGASLNAGFECAFDESPLVLYAVDDWELTQELDLTSWVEILTLRDDIGVVRLGPPHPYTKGYIETVGKNWQSWILRLDRYGFAFGHRPALYHKRFIDHYGWFDEKCSALECERLYNERYCSKPGPDVVLALQHPWYHDSNEVSLSELEPK